MVTGYTYAVPGVYYLTIPQGVQIMVIQCWGAGGCGGGRNSAGYGGGGGGGSYAIGTQVIGQLIGKSGSVLLSDLYGSVLTIDVGAGGVSGSGTIDGGRSRVVSDGGVAVGGYGGVGCPANTATGQLGSTTWVGDNGYNGGNGATGSGVIGGGGGGGEGAGTTVNGNSSTTRAGGTGTDGGDGGAGKQNTTQGAGSPGSMAGGGGGGCWTNTTTATAGGRGADGRIVITFTINNALLSGGDEFF